VLYAFSAGGDGWDLLGPLTFDAAGNLYGTTGEGGNDNCSVNDGFGCGTVFELSPAADGSWAKTRVYDFEANQGWYPWGTKLIIDAAGNLYGTAFHGGVSGYGVAFELTPNADGSWTEKVLHEFQPAGSGGDNPNCGLLFDAAGNLYGTTFYAGAHGYGNVFELVPTAGGGWEERILHQFTGGKDGANPFAGLTFDGAGNLYGTATGGGADGYGVIFELLPQSGGGWNERVLHAFTGSGGETPNGVIFDAAGNLYGSTWAGTGNGGVVYEITP
jgi:hypothetical protein